MVQASHRLIDGWRRFRDQGWAAERDRWLELAGGQTPRTMVIACSDSRVEPAEIFDTRPGEIFVLRNVAALVPPFETAPGRHGVSAAVEFAVEFLAVDDIVVLGHGLCGGCDAALHGTMRDAPKGAGGFIADWIALLDEARAAVLSAHPAIDHEASRAMELAAVRTSIANLRTFPNIARAESDGRLSLHGAYFAISDGLLHWMDPADGRFHVPD